MILLQTSVIIITSILIIRVTITLKKSSTTPASITTQGDLRQFRSLPVVHKATTSTLAVLSRQGPLVGGVHDPVHGRRLLRQLRSVADRIPEADWSSRFSVSAAVQCNRSNQEENQPCLHLQFFFTRFFSGRFLGNFSCVIILMFLLLKFYLVYYFRTPILRLPPQKCILLYAHLLNWN